MNKLILIFLCTGSMVFAQETKVEFDAEAVKVLDKSSAALGEKAVYDKITSSILHGKMALPQNISATVTTYEKGDSKVLTEVKASAPGINYEMRQGCDGKDCYSHDSMMGTRMLEGQEKETMLMQNSIKSHMNWRDLYQTLKFEGKADVNGRETYKIAGTSKDGMTMVNYYDSENYLLLRTDMQTNGPMGAMSMEMYFHDYKTHEGVKYASRVETKVMGQSFDVIIESLEFNVPIPDDKFKLPAGLK